jgi:hypothetical protein
VLVGRHDDQDPALNVDAELYRLLGVEPPDSAGRDKPPCCDQSTDLPPVLGAAVTEFVDRAAKVRRTRRQSASLPRMGRGRRTRHGQSTRTLAACRQLAAPALPHRRSGRHTVATLGRADVAGRRPDLDAAMR